MRRLALLLPAAAALAAAGCDPYGMNGYEPDTRPTVQSRQVLAGYDHRPAPEIRQPVPARPDPRPPVIDIPGKPERPWSEPPRTVRTPRPPVIEAQPEVPVVPTVPTAPSQPEPTQTPAATPPANPPAAPTEFGNIKRTIGAGDQITVSVKLHPEFGGLWKVGSEGLIEVPAEKAFGKDLLSPEKFATDIGSVLGKKPEELAERIATALSPYISSKPVVEVVIFGRGEG